MSASEPYIPTPEEFAQPVRPQLTPLQILSLAQIFHDERELALQLAADYGRRPLAGVVAEKP